jgi:hypothetical protein
MSALRRRAQILHAVEPAAELALQPSAVFWVAACGWVPGTGHCHNRDCAQACIFAPQRAAEAHRVARRRRLRRSLIFQRDAP